MTGHRQTRATRLSSDDEDTDAEDRITPVAPSPRQAAAQQRLRVAAASKAAAKRTVKVNKPQKKTKQQKVRAAAAPTASTPKPAPKKPKLASSTGKGQQTLLTPRLPVISPHPTASPSPAAAEPVTPASRSIMTLEQSNEALSQLLRVTTVRKFIPSPPRTSF